MPRYRTGVSDHGSVRYGGSFCLLEVDEVEAGSMVLEETSGESGILLTSSWTRGGSVWSRILVP